MKKKKPIPITEVMPLPNIPGVQMNLDKELALLRSAMAAAALAGNSPVTARALEAIATIEKANLKVKILASDLLPKTALHALGDRIVDLASKHIDTTQLRIEVHDKIRTARNDQTELDSS